MAEEREAVAKNKSKKSERAHGGSYYMSGKIIGKTEGMRKEDTDTETSVEVSLSHSPIVSTGRTGTPNCTSTLIGAHSLLLILTPPTPLINKNQKRRRKKKEVSEQHTV